MSRTRKADWFRIANDDIVVCVDTRAPEHNVTVQLLHPFRATHRRESWGDCVDWVLAQFGRVLGPVLMTRADCFVDLQGWTVEKDDPDHLAPYGWKTRKTSYVELVADGKVRGTKWFAETKRKKWCTNGALTGFQVGQAGPIKLVGYIKTLELAPSEKTRKREMMFDQWKAAAAFDAAADVVRLEFQARGRIFRELGDAKWNEMRAFLYEGGMQALWRYCVGRWVTEKGDIHSHSRRTEAPMSRRWAKLAAHPFGEQDPVAMPKRVRRIGAARIQQAHGSRRSVLALRGELGELRYPRPADPLSGELYETLDQFTDAVNAGVRFKAKDIWPLIERQFVNEYLVFVHASKDEAIAHQETKLRKEGFVPIDEEHTADTVAMLVYADDRARCDGYVMRATKVDEMMRPGLVSRRYEGESVRIVAA